MNRSIFQIDKDFVDIFNEIEENGGEITPELEERLKIGQEEVTNKVRNYCNLINATKADIAAIKVEQDRLKSLQKSKENLIKGITNLVIFAINNYGNEDKKGKRSIDWGTGRVSIRPSQSVEVDDTAVSIITNTIKSTFASLKFANVLDDGDAIDTESILDTLENNQDPITGEPDPISVDNNDLDIVNATVSFEIPMSKLIKGDGYQMMSCILKHGGSSWNVKGSVDKSLIKARITSGISSNIANLVNNENLNIK